MRSSTTSRRWVIYAISALLFSLSLFTAFGERGVFHLWRLWGDKKRLEERNFLLQTENDKLRERIYRIRSDDLYLEKIAREELGLVRPGEIIYRFPYSESKKNRTSAITGLASESPRSSGQTPPP
jgi:cell division protein FtsB